jgi:hypothetical protein
MAKAKTTQQWMVESIGGGLPSAFELAEAKNKPGRMIARGMFGLCDQQNGNGRVYPSKLMEAQVARLQPLIENGQVTCQLDHPADGKPSLALAAAKLTNLYMDGSKIMGEAELLNTPSGQILKALWEGGVVTGVSSRGWGSTKHTEEGEVVQEDFRLVTFDFVSDPSVKDALPKIYMEGMEGPGEADADPVVMFKSSFPDSYATLMEHVAIDAVAKAKDEAAQAVEAAVDAERARVTNALRETFEHNLRDALVGLREDLAVEIRAEFAADPEIGGAKAALAQIIEMVSAYHRPLAPDAMEDALRAADLELEGERAKVEELEHQVAKGHRLMELEQRIARHPLAEQLRKVLVPVVAVGTVNLDEAIREFVAQSDGMVPAADVEALAAERMQLAEERKQSAALAKRVKELESKVRTAQEIGEALNERLEAAQQESVEADARVDQLQAQLKKRDGEVYRMSKMLGLPNVREVMANLTEAEIAEVDRTVAQQRTKSMVDDRLEAAKQHFRGIGPGSDRFRHINEGHDEEAPAGQAPDGTIGLDAWLNG